MQGWRDIELYRRDNTLYRAGDTALYILAYDTFLKTFTTLLLLILSEKVEKISTPSSFPPIKLEVTSADKAAYSFCQCYLTILLRI
jgi:hypothetical protein